MWRFEAIINPDVEIMMSRDTDTRILSREILAVREWMDSDKLFHIMRDHPHHSSNIMGGMFGIKKGCVVDWENLINECVQQGQRDYDQNFVSNIIYPLVVSNSMIHTSFNRREPHAKSFPIPFDSEFRFVGEYVYADDSRSNYHIMELTKCL
jgi:hypothetical protein